jgi:hypothetical protein
MEDVIELDERHLRLFEIHLASTPQGAAAAEFWRAELDLLDDLPLEPPSAVFLLQAMPLTSRLLDLRQLADDLPERWMTRDDGALQHGTGPHRTFRGLVFESSDGWHVDIHPNGYLALVVDSLPDRAEIHPHFSLHDQIAPRLTGFADLCSLVAGHLDLGSAATWRLRCTVLNGPAVLLVGRDEGSRWKGYLPDDVIDLTDVETVKLPQHLKSLTLLLEDLGTVQDLGTDP